MMPSTCRISDWPERRIDLRAVEDELIILTKDDDFRDTRTSNGARVVWLGCGNIANAKLLLFLEPRWHQVLVELDEGRDLIELR